MKCKPTTRGLELQLGDTRFRLEIYTDNDAFQAASWNQMGHEIANILEQAAHRLRRGAYAGSLADINGNTVGSYGFDAG